MFGRKPKVPSPECGEYRIQINGLGTITVDYYNWGGWIVCGSGRLRTVADALTYIRDRRLSEEWRTVVHVKPTDRIEEIIV